MYPAEIPRFAAARARARASHVGWRVDGHRSLHSRADPRRGEGLRAQTEHPTQYVLHSLSFVEPERPASRSGGLIRHASTHARACLRPSLDFKIR